MLSLIWVSFSFHQPHVPSCSVALPANTVPSKEGCDTALTSFCQALKEGRLEENSMRTPSASSSSARASLHTISHGVLLWRPVPHSQTQENWQDGWMYMRVTDSKANQKELGKKENKIPLLNIF